MKKVSFLHHFERKFFFVLYFFYLLTKVFAVAVDLRSRRISRVEHMRQVGDRDKPKERKTVKRTEGKAVRKTEKGQTETNTE
jgi:hypothetical protein